MSKLPKNLSGFGNVSKPKAVMQGNKLKGAVIKKTINADGSASFTYTSFNDEKGAMVHHGVIDTDGNATLTDLEVATTRDDYLRPVGPILYPARFK